MSGSTDCYIAVTNSQCSEVYSGMFKCLCKAGYHGVDGGSQCEQSTLNQSRYKIFMMIQ